jgi:hypothetical protein
MIQTATLAVALMPLAVPAVAQDFDPDYLATFSIIARDPATGELGFAVQSKAFAAGNRAALRAKVRELRRTSRAAANSFSRIRSRKLRRPALKFRVPA